MAVTRAGPGFVALGHDASGPMAWFSPDGIAWETATLPLNMPRFTSSDDFAFWEGLVARDGRLVAAGNAWLEVGHLERPLFWTSVDGTTWGDVQLDEVTNLAVDGPLSQVRGLASGRSGIVAVGSRSLDDAAVWVSADGLSWHSAPPGQAAFVSPFPDGFTWGGIRAVAAGPGGYVAVGGDGQCGGGECPSAETAIWTSTDGESWERVPSATVFQTSEGRGWVSAWDVVAWGSRFAAVGEWDAHDAVWISALPEE